MKKLYTAFWIAACSLASLPGHTQSQWQNDFSNQVEPTPQISNSSNIQPVKYSSRPIIIASDGTYTDAPAGSYSTAHASATAQITIGN